VREKGGERRGKRKSVRERGREGERMRESEREGRRERGGRREVSKYKCSLVYFFIGGKCSLVYYELYKTN